jgi:putative phosphoesterase
MKTAFISDIHGNFEALKVVLTEIDRLGVDRIFCLGDVVGYYSQVNECCDELRKRGIPSVMGNHDWYLAGGGFCMRSKSVNDCLEYQRKIISRENIEWIRSFPLFRDVDELRMVHGGWTDPIDEYLDPSIEYFDQVDGSVFISGHTHRQIVKSFGEKIYCNPGSVGQPRDGDPRAAFAIYESGEFALYRFEYNMERVFELMESAGFNDFYYGGLKTGAPRLRRLAD